MGIPPHLRTASSLEKLIGCGARCALLCHVGFDALDLVTEELHSRTELFDREQCQILPDLMRDLFLGFVVVINRRHLRLLPQKSSGRWHGCHIAEPRLNKMHPATQTTRTQWLRFRPK